MDFTNERSALIGILKKLGFFDLRDSTNLRSYG